MLAADEAHGMEGAVEVQQTLHRIKQHGSDATPGLDPVRASAPPQLNPPASISSPVPIRSSATAPTHPPTVPMSAPSIPAPSPAFGQIPLLNTPTPQTSGSSSLASLWTQGFIILFGLMLALTIVGSAIALNIPHPSGPGNLA